MMMLGFRPAAIADRPISDYISGSLMIMLPSCWDSDPLLSATTFSDSLCTRRRADESAKTRAVRHVGIPTRGSAVRSR